jgi:sulfite reductase (ferredoxin)
MSGHKHEDSANPTTLAGSALHGMSKAEHIKHASEGLFYVATSDGARHTLHSEIEALSAREADTITDHAKEVAKHFGIYKQRIRNESGRKTGDFIFMVRVKNPAGGELTPEQWLALDQAADRYGDGSLRLTARQGIQFHYVHGENLRALVRHLNGSYRDRGYKITTLGACGDVNRNTVASPIDDLDAELPLDSRTLAHEVARELAPKTSAYYQVFLTDEHGANVAPVNADEPLYGPQYLPRKFKVGFAHPHDNSIDLLTNDVGFIPVVRNGRVLAYDFYSGGGLGMTHNQPETQPLLALHLGRVRREQIVDAVRAIATIQRDNGERKNRRAARWKYTIRRLGVDHVKQVLRKDFAIELHDAAPSELPAVRDLLGWYREAGEDDRWYVGVMIPCGRVRDSETARYRTAVRHIVDGIEDIGIRVTPNQNLILTHIPASRREFVERTLTEHRVAFDGRVAPIHRLAMACPAKPTCGLAMTHAERALPEYLAELERAGLGDVDVMVRMAGCPNGCSRPTTAEIGIVGYGKNDYVLMVGGARNGSRLARTLFPRLGEHHLRQALKGLVTAIRDHNPHHLAAGDFLAHTSDEKLRAFADITH